MHVQFLILMRTLNLLALYSGAGGRKLLSHMAYGIKNRSRSTMFPTDSNIQGVFFPNTQLAETN